MSAHNFLHDWTPSSLAGCVNQNDVQDDLALIENLAGDLSSFYSFLSPEGKSRAMAFRRRLTAEKQRLLKSIGRAAARQYDPDQILIPFPKS